MLVESEIYASVIEENKESRGADDMTEKLPILCVNMLGRFSMSYGGQAISFKRNTATNAMKLLQILLHATGTPERGIPRTQLWEELFGREELTNVANNLRVTVHRLKKMIQDTCLPEHEYIKIEKGIYKWDSPMPVYIDALDFAEKVEAAKQETEEERKMQMLLEACRLYKGEFLPALSGEDWVIVPSVQYKKLYAYAMTEVCECLKKRREYEIILDLAGTAAEIYPFDEYQVFKIDALMALNRYKEAHDYYDETSKMFFEELGISPSEKMMNQFRKMSKKMSRKYQGAGEIKEGLKEKSYEDGAYYTQLPSFRDSYRLVRRIIERNGQSVFLMICSITDSQGRPMESKEKLEVLANNLHKAIKGSLRRGDAFTKYSPSQFLIMLVGANRENCDVIYERILGHFTEHHKTWKQNLQYYASSVADTERGNSRIRFHKNEFYWK